MRYIKCGDFKKGKNMSAYIDIIFLISVVVFVLFRLYSVLGTRPDNENKVVFLSKEDFKKVNPDLAKEIATKLNLVDEKEDENCDFLSQIPNFNRNDFCTRASKVFEMVLNAFACNDEKTLKMLMDKKLFTKFKKIMQQRQEDKLCAETDLIKIENISIENAIVNENGIANIVVKFISEQINILKNAAGEVIEGDENFVQKITDVWTFEKDINSPSRVWLLTSTKKS